MWRGVGLMLFLLCLCAVLPAAAVAEKHVALVIGNSAYGHTHELLNPRNDAADMAAALEKLGFEIVLGIDLDKPAMDRKIRDFATRLTGADTGLLFYAGHGLQVGGVNYLVPIDAQLTASAALDFEMVRLDLVQRTMEREARTNILFLDACRDNPLARNLARAMGTRGGVIGRGLAAAESGVGTLISYSTQPGNVALDGTGRNSPFTAALVRKIATPGDDLSAVLINVRRSVMEATQSQQVPWEHSALTGRFYFATASAPGGAAPGGAAPGSAATTLEAARAWETVKASENVSVLQAFRRQFGAANPFYDSLAVSRIDAIEAKPARRPATEEAATKADGTARAKQPPGERVASLAPDGRQPNEPAAPTRTGKPDATEGWTGRISGTYEGFVVSSGKRTPATTTFSRGGTTGHYRYRNNDVRKDRVLFVNGRLHGCRPLRSLVLRCSWQAESRSGTMTIKFNDTLTSFDGSWVSSSNTRYNQWTGSRAR